MSSELIVRALLLIEMDPNESMKKWFSHLGFTGTHYKGQHYDKIGKTDVDIFHKDNPYKPKYSVVSVDFDNNHALTWDHKAAKYKKLPFSSIRLNPNTLLSTED